MCGLVGIAGNIKLKHSNMFKDMLLFDTVRGLHSTGVALVGYNNKTVIVEKEIGHPQNLWKNKEYSEFDEKGLVYPINKVLMGHNRYATVGNITKENAHPFTYGNITGAHNGSLTQWWGLEGWGELDVDSKAIFKTIDEKGIDHCWKNFYGAAALSFWDKEKGTLNLIRNSQRPLFVAYGEDDDVIYWASESWMIDVAAVRNGFKLKKTKDKNGNLLDEIFQLKEDTLHTFEPTFKNCTLKEVRELEKKTYNCQMGYQTTTSKVINNVDKTRINEGWSKGLLKADKSLRGQFATLKYLVEHQLRKYAMLRLDNGDELRVYPQKNSELDIWRYRCKNKTEMKFKLMYKPRISGPTKKPNYYAVSNGGVKIHSKTPQNKSNEPYIKLVDKVFKQKEDIEDIEMYECYEAQVSKKRWHEIMKKMSPKYCCACCGDVITEEDQKYLFWIGPTTVACTLCKNDGALMSDKLKFV